jgi:DHA1 family inner membrane transport protein
VLLGALDHQFVFWILVTAWGLFYWMAIPGVYNLLSARSRFPAERAGDAQASMAAGRAIGPLLGGFVVAAGGFRWLGITGGIVMAAGAIAIIFVELLGRERRGAGVRAPAVDRA